jgi:ATP-dependent DNA ligase
VIHVMKATPVDIVPDDVVRWVQQPKWDGWRIVAGRHAGGCWLQTSSGNRVTSVPYITEALAEWLPIDTVVDGEIVDLAGATQWNRTQSILSAGRTHVPSKVSPALTFVVFDILHLDGTDVRSRPLTLRLELLEKLGDVGEAKNVVGDGRCLRISPWHETNPVLAQTWVDAGWEGVVCKRWESRYHAGRSGAWVKWKPDKEIEALCTGTYEATPGSKYEGVAVGGITFRVTHEDGRVYDGRAAGMNDALRRELYEHPERYVGRVVELTYKLITRDGALRHPNFRRWRDRLDKAEPVVTTPVRVAPKRVATGGRIRNYASMGDAKLLGAIADLEAGAGDAYDRCINTGSGDPAHDLAVARSAADRRGL